jgi:hypothetical protein
MGKTFKDQKRYDRKKKPHLPRVTIDWDTGTRVEDDRRNKHKHPKRDWLSDREADWDNQQNEGTYLDGDS